MQIDVTVANRGATAMTGQGYYLFSPGSSTRASFTLAGGATSFVPNAFPSRAVASNLLNGPVRLSPTTGNAADLLATVRSLRVLPDGGTFGYLLPAESAAKSLTQGSTTTLFTGAHSGHVSILNLYSLVDAKATLTLFAPDGTLRGSKDVDVVKNASLSFNPAASAFGVAAEPGDAIRVAVTTGTLQASVLVYDPERSTWRRRCPPRASTARPAVGRRVRERRPELRVRPLYLEPVARHAADVPLAFYGVGAAGATATANLSLAPLETRRSGRPDDPLRHRRGAGRPHRDVEHAHRGRDPRRDAVSTGTTAPSPPPSMRRSASPTGRVRPAIGLPQTATRSGLLDLYNSGARGDVTINGFLATARRPARSPCTSA